MGPIEFIWQSFVLRRQAKEDLVSGIGLKEDFHGIPFPQTLSFRKTRAAAIQKEHTEKDSSVNDLPSSFRHL